VVEDREALRGLLVGHVPPAEVPGDVRERNVRRADPERGSDLAPQAQCLFCGREGLVHLVSDHAFGGERVKQFGALARWPSRGEPQCGSIVERGLPV
jgi:hypothetical protein